MEIPVRVAVRVRPLAASEEVRDCESCVRVSGGRTVGLGKRRFTFDVVYDEDCGQEELFHHSVADLVEGCLEGYNATVLAYGQTGSGKTFTMGMSGSRLSAAGTEGILPRACKLLLERIAQTQHKAQYNVKISYLEIYNETVRDLLSPSSTANKKHGKRVQIRDKSNGDVVVQGAKEVEVRSLEQVVELLEIGAAYRATGSTQMNAHSSRSHAIFSIHVEQINTQAGWTRTAKLHLVDLAGSERNKRTGAVGERFQESIQINQGLLSLGNVISILGDEERQTSHKHVPYRQSKLTRLLRDSLGGNSRTLFIACISPADESYAETLNTLKYANRARNIKNTPIINDALPSPNPTAQEQDHVRRLEAEVDALLQEKKQAALLIEQAEQQPQPQPIVDIRKDLLTLMDGAQSGDVSPGKAFTRLFLGLRRLLKRADGMQLIVNGGDDERGSLACEDPACLSEKRGLKSDLQEARADLERDEIIFAKKVDELQSVQTQLKQVYEDREQLRLRVIELEEENRQLLVDSPASGVRNRSGGKDVVHSPASFQSAFGGVVASVTPERQEKLRRELAAKDLALAEAQSQLKQLHTKLDKLEAAFKAQAIKHGTEAKQLQHELSKTQKDLARSEESRQNLDQVIQSQESVIQELTLQLQESKEKEELWAHRPMEQRVERRKAMQIILSRSIEKSVRSYYSSQQAAKSRQEIHRIDKARRELEQSLGSDTNPLRKQMIHLAAKLSKVDEKIEAIAAENETSGGGLAAQLEQERAAIRRDLELLSAEEALVVQQTLDSIEQLNHQEDFAREKIKQKESDVALPTCDLAELLQKELAFHLRGLAPVDTLAMLDVLCLSLAALQVEKVETSQSIARLKVRVQERTSALEYAQNELKREQLDRSTETKQLQQELERLQSDLQNERQTRPHSDKSDKLRKLDQEYIATLERDIKFYVKALAELKAKAKHTRAYYAEIMKLKEQELLEKYGLGSKTPGAKAARKEHIRIARNALKEISVQALNAKSPTLDRPSSKSAPSPPVVKTANVKGYDEAMTKAWEHFAK